MKDENDRFTENLDLRIKPEDSRCISINVSIKELALIEPILIALRERKDHA